MEEIATVMEIFQADTVLQSRQSKKISYWWACEENNKETFFYCATNTLE